MIKSINPLLMSALLVFSACTNYKASDNLMSPDEVSAKHFNPNSYVDVFIGTDGKGKTYPGATVPHGMVQLSPDNGRNGWDWISGYFYPDNIIAGFSHTHLSGTGAGDLYDISFMPLTKPYYREKTEGGPEQGTIVSRFKHKNERAEPGYYQVHLDDYDIKVELSSGLRTGYQRYFFPKSASQGVVRLDLGYSRNWDKTLKTHLEIIDNKTIAGYRMSTGWAEDQRVYFYTRFSRPFKDHVINNDDQITKHNAKGINLSSEFIFENQDSNSITVRTAISSVSVANAKQNLLSEGINKNFDTVRDEAKQAWNKELSKVIVKASDDNLKQFYTAMYHAALAPRIFSDVNGQYKGPDGNTQQTQTYPRYEFFSLWDTFRALHPWKTIVDPKRTREMMASLKSHYDTTGVLPVWIFQGNETNMMMGYHSVPVMVDAYLKGQTDIDGKELLAASIKSATQKEFGIDSYQEFGYVPYDEQKWNVSLGLEYAYDDWAIAKLANALGDQEVYQRFLQRSQNYQRHFDPSTGFMRAKNRQGQFRIPFEPNAYKPEDYCEANAWQYSFFVPHDVEGLITLFGGPDEFVNKLDAMFNTEQASDELPEWISGFIGQYVHGNEPSHHVPYLYQYAGQAHKTQALVRRIMHELYTTEPNGLAGNEDAGQMSAWYLFSALGFYPVDPVSGEYVLGSPEVDSAQIRLANGKTFTVIANNQSADNVYVSSVSLNGKTLKHHSISHQDIMAGGKLVFTMSAEQP